MLNRHSQSVLMFHGIGEANHPYEPGEQDYWISRDAFDQALDACTGFPSSQYLLTFDDGNASDVDAARVMAARGLTGVFFVLVGRIGRPGYLSEDDILEMMSLGMEIGLHGRDHLDWRRIDDDTLKREIDASGDELASICNTDIRSVAIPYGAYDRRVWQYLNNSRYDRIYTSNRGLSNCVDRFVRRNPVMAWHNKDDIHRLIQGYASPLVRMRRAAAARIKRLT